MPRSSQAITRFSSGEVTPLLAGRIDTDQYPQFVQKMENCYVEKHGGVKGRGGTHFVTQTKKSQVRLVPFIFSREESYVMEFGDRYIRFHRNSGFVTNPDRIQQYTARLEDVSNLRMVYDYGSDFSEFTGDGTTTVFVYDYDDSLFSSYDVYVDGILQTENPAADYDIVIGTNTVTFTTAPADGEEIVIRGFLPTVTIADIDVYLNDVLQTVTTDYVWTYSAEGLYTGGWASAFDPEDVLRFEIPEAGDTEDFQNELNTAASTDYVLEIGSPYSASELDELYWTQANDVMIFCHYAHPPMNLERLGDILFELFERIYIGALWQSPTSSWIADGTQTVFNNFFQTTSSANIRVYVNDVQQTITTDYTVATGSAADSAVTFVSAPTQGSLINFYATYTHGWSGPLVGFENLYPRCVTFFQERLWFAGTLYKPQTLYGSRTADFGDFFVPRTNVGQELVPDSPIEYTIAAYTHEAIEWLSSERVLVIGTSSTEHRLSPDEYVATDRVPLVSKMTSFGGAHQIPMYMGGLTCFVQRAGNQIRSFKQSYDSVLEEYESIDLNWMASHMTEELYLKEPSYALTPDTIAWMVREDGQMMTAMYDPSFGQMDVKEIGWSRQITDGSVKSLTSIPVTFSDQVWLATEKTIDSETVVHIEYIDASLNLDSGLTYSGTSVTVLTNLDHLEGEEVVIVADGLLQAPKTVTSGSITLDTAATQISVGKAFTKKLWTMPFVGANNQGTGKGRLGRWNEIFIELYKSARPKLNGQIPKNVSRTELHSTPVRIFNLGYDRDKVIKLEQDKPVTMNIISLYGEISTGNG